MYDGTIFVLPNYTFQLHHRQKKENCVFWCIFVKLDLLSCLFKMNAMYPLATRGSTACCMTWSNMAAVERLYVLPLNLTFVAARVIPRSRNARRLFCQMSEHSAEVQHRADRVGQEVNFRIKHSVLTPDHISLNLTAGVRILCTHSSSVKPFFKVGGLYFMTLLSLFIITVILITFIFFHNVKVHLESACVLFYAPHKPYFPCTCFLVSVCVLDYFDL